MKKLRQRGELALTLSLIGIFISLVGIGLGTQLSRDIQQSSSQASGSTYTYKSTLEIRDEKGTVLQWEEGMTWSSNLKDSNIPEKSAGDVKMPNDSRAHVIYDATGPSGVPSAVQNFAATITVAVPEGYEIVKSFCEDRVGTSCAGVRTSSGQLARVIPNIRITNGAEIVYGIIVRKVGTKPTSCRIKTPECKPQNLRFDQVSEHNITVKWDNPDSCTPYIYDQDRFWIDVIRPGEQGSADQIVCATDSGDEEATCTLGKAVPAGREIDTTSQEFTTKKWDQNRTYTLNVYLHNNADSCLSDPAGVSFSYTSKPPKPTVTASPTDEPATPTPTAEPTVTTTQQPTAKLTVAPTTQPTKAPSDDTATVRIKVNYNGLYSLSSKEKHQFYLESCDDNNGTAVNCGTASNKKTGMVTLIKSDATKRFYGMTLQNVPVGKKRIVIRHLIDGKESRILRVSTTQCNSHDGSQYECPLELTKDQAKDIYFDVFFKTTSPRPTDRPQPTPQPTQVPTEIPIKHISGNGPVRVVVIPVGFSSIEEFERLVTEKIITAIKKTNIAEHEDDFTYLMVNSIAPKLNCEWSLSSGVICPTHDYIHKARAATQSNYAIVIKNIPMPSDEQLIGAVGGSTELTEFGYGKNVKTKSIFYIPSFVFDKRPDSLIHEYGHGFAGLADEYVNTVYTDELLLSYGLNLRESVNCSEIKNSACKWGAGSGCFEGCSLANFGRSTDTSLMNNKYKMVQTQKDGVITITPTLDLNFNPISLEQMKLFFEKAKANSPRFKAQSDDFYLNSLHVSLDQPAIDSLQLRSVESLSVYAQEKSVSSGPSYIFEILDAQNNSLFETSTSKYIFRTHSLEPLQLNNPDLYLPFFPDADHIVITNEKGETILTINLADYGPMAAVEGASACGNSYCDAAIGETATSCRADCGAHLAYSELERADIDGNGVVNGLDLAMVIDTNAYQLSSEGDIDGDLKTNALDYTLLLKWLGTETN